MAKVAVQTPVRTDDDQDLVRLQQWIGRTETAEDLITFAPVQGLAATLDLEIQVEMGAVLPPLWHWLYFLPRAPQIALGVDGHPRTGGFLPPVPLPRRMWAGGRLHWHTPLRIGQAVQRRSTITAVTHKRGRSGDLVFVTLRHEFHTAEGLALSEEQDLVYRDPPRAGEPIPEGRRAQVESLWHRSLRPDELLLFRFSALTFNAHRIHYDVNYATQGEGYPGLVVHGPLQAVLLAELACRKATGSAMTNFEFKATRPAFAGQTLRVCGSPDAEGAKTVLWAEDEKGFITMEAHAGFHAN